MNNQPIFKSYFSNNLRIKIDKNIQIGYTSSFSIKFDEKDILWFKNLKRPSNLINDLNFNDDFISAIKIFEAFENLLPIQASDDRFWHYLTHVDLYGYMLKRWPKILMDDIKDIKEYLFEHFILKNTSQSNLIRNGISGLWWSVFLSKDENRKDKYELTEILFKNQTLRTRTLGVYKLVRNKEAVIALLEFFKENEKEMTNFEKQHQEVVEFLNMYGGIVNIGYLKKDDFKEILKKFQFK